MSLGAAHYEHQKIASDIPCNNIGLYFSAALEFKGDKGPEN